MGPVQAFGIEGTGSHGAGLSRFLRERGHAVFEGNRPNRQLRYQQGKSDAVDAESAARAVLAGQAAGHPKSGTGTVEMIPHLKIARDTAVKARTQAMQTLKAIIVCSPDALREQLDQVSGKKTLLRRLAALRPGPLTSRLASAKASLRAIARRWLLLDAEIKQHDTHLATPGRGCGRGVQKKFGAGLEALARRLGIHPADIEVWLGDQARVGQKNKITRRWAKRGSRPFAPHGQRTTHGSAKLVAPDNITIVPLPPKCPELNPQENVWQYLRDNWLSNRVFTSYINFADHCAYAWNRLVAEPWRIMSLGLRTWAHGF